MPDQIAITIGEDQELVAGPCAWCGTPTTTRLVLEKPRYTVAANGVRVMAKRAIEAWVCTEHERSLVRRHVADPAPGMVVKDS